MNIDKQIEFDKVKELWTDLAITDYAKEKINEIALCFSENELKTELRMQICPNCGKPIAPCGLCNMDFVKCNECPLGCN